MKIVKGAESLFDQLKFWRRYLHEHPELSFEEVETAKFVVNELKKIDNIKIETNVGGHGVVATLTSGHGPTIAVRADMDALPIKEENDHSFVSKHEGVMHACGHDAHTAMLLGAVHLLSEQFNKGQLTGTVKFIFQPAEESTDEHGLSGAPYMIRDGVLQDVESVIALHVCPWHPVGVVQMNTGFSMANVDVFEATIKGTGGHGGYPHLATDPLWMLGAVLQTFYGTVGRRISPLDIVAASIGKIEAGAVSNVIPAEVKVEGTLRSYSPEAREKLAEEVEQVFKLVETFGGSYEFELEKGEPALNNHMEVNMVIEQAISEIYPDMHIHWEPFGMGGEDFGYMTEEIPGSMFFLGCSLEDGLDRDLHTPIFDIDENCLPIGTAIFVAAVNRFLKREESHHPLKRNSIQRGA
ncbi:M20 family metallopeptidase [Pseudogracilibacillus auburnensis]|uniref:Amidohydrolase n=1 Tax=Pseudogracilibacillus auburnensis TaxID=1494959 RepID=A0A2V3W2S1_9BACI|nr:amidohydrolase [Pseudogracilibacillus auburnensis]MBO1002105.1 amidohydrolase [Pseudogracilibacillus auburnensis]PXW87428.1 amidohydrolase [Pseudogracilibacillus auburnensis]